jgi:hypothetical protein
MKSIFYQTNSNEHPSAILIMKENTRVFVTELLDKMVIKSPPYDNENEKIFGKKRD